MPGYSVSILACVQPAHSYCQISSEHALHVVKQHTLGHRPNTELDSGTEDILLCLRRERQYGACNT